MSEIVFILGAGASQHAGAPLMHDFLDKADALRKKGETGGDLEHFDRVFEAISNLQVVHSKAELALDNLETVFGAFEMARLLGVFPGLGRDQIEGLQESFRRLVARTLEATMRFPVQDHHVNPPNHYDNFANLVKHLDKDGRQRRCTIITFNYDIGLDYALQHCCYPATYSLEDEGEDNQRSLLLKLHGSLNWASCSKCSKVYAWQLESFFRGKSLSRLREWTSIELPIASKLAQGEFKHCADAPVDAPFLVPPTWNKTQYHSSVAAVWRRAAKELSDAELIFVSGYSLTESDSFFRYLLALGAVGPARIRRFWLVDPSESSDVENRFRKLLGTAAVARFKRSKEPFEFVRSAVAMELGITPP